MTQEENKAMNSNNIQMIVIIVLLVVIAIMGYFLGKNSATPNTDVANQNTNNSNVSVTKTGDFDDLSITVYDDKRCTNCATEQIMAELKKLPSLENVEFVKKDFSDKGVSDYLKENSITALPIIVFSTNNFDVSLDPTTDPNGQPLQKITTYLQQMKDGTYQLPLGAASSFEPFKERSERGMLLLDKAKLKEIKDSSFIKGNKDAKITWLEFSDLECPFCAKLHKSTTKEDLIKKYGDDLNIIFDNYPLPFHKNAQTAAEIIECVGDQKGADAYYSLIDTSYGHAKELDTGNIDTSESSSKSYLIDAAVSLGVDEADLNKCLDSGKFKDKVASQMDLGSKEFGVTGTPGSILINNETGEYEVISGAYPTDSFVSAIDKLLGK